MEPINQFVIRHAPPILPAEEKKKPIKGVPSLQHLVCVYLYEADASVKDLDIGVQVAFLERCGNPNTWCEMRHMCSEEAFDTATKIISVKFNLPWSKLQRPFQTMLGHLFEQAIRSSKVKKDELDEIIVVKRQYQNQIIALRDRTLTGFERSIMAFNYAWNYNINFNNLQIGPVIPGLINLFSFCYFHWYFKPKLVGEYTPRGLNLLVNHLPARTFPICHKVYRCAWWFDWLPWISGQVANTNPMFYRTVLTTQVAAKFIVEYYTLPAKITSLAIDSVASLTEGVTPLLSKVESYSELCRYNRELREVKALWLAQPIDLPQDDD